MSAALTRDAFLDGRLHLWQPQKGYRAGVDPVFLAASVPASTGQTVLELGCGVGTALLCLQARVPELELTGVELQSDYANLAAENAKSAGAKMTVVQADIAALPADLRQRRFDHVIMNPPYFERHKGPASPDAGRDRAMGEQTPLDLWLETGIRRVGPKGYLTIIQRIERLPEVLETLQGRLGSVVVLPLAGRRDQPAGRFLLQARQEGRAPFKLLAPWVLHEGAAHVADKESYTPQTRAILRDAQGLCLGR